MIWVVLWLSLGLLGGIVIRLEHGKVSLQTWLICISLGGITLIGGLVIGMSFVTWYVDRIWKWMGKVKL